MDAPRTPRADPSVQILTNEAALHSLRRPQLQALAKQYGLKAGGKNVELIERLEQHGRYLGGDDSMLDADESNASWAVLREAVVPEQEELAEFGYQESASAGSSWRSKATISASSSSGSIAATIRSASASILRAFTDPVPSAHKPEPAAEPVQDTSPPPSAPSIYPSLEQYSPKKNEEEEREVLAPSSECTDYEDGGIRLVSSRSTIHSVESVDEVETEDAPPVPALPPTTSATAPAFVFGSPVQSRASPPTTFSFAMPGSLFSSTTSSVAPKDEGAPKKTAAELVMEEMNRRAAEAKAANVGALSLAGSTSTLLGGLGTKPSVSPTKGSKEAFDLSHKRAFAQMDSIVNHASLKRLVPSTSSTTVSGMARSSSSRALSASAAPTSDERASKRFKPSTSKPSSLNRLPKFASSKNLVNGLREAGWSAAPAPSTSVSLSSSLMGASTATSGKGRGKEVREDVKPAAEREREQRRRQLEMAKARRKSQAAVTGGIGLSRRRPSLNVGPKPSGSTASRFLKSTFKKLSPSVSSTASASTASTSTKPLPSSTSAPRFASSTALTSSRIAFPASASPVASLKKQPRWKKFDLQESLKRPMSWKAATGSSESVKGKAVSMPAAASSLPRSRSTSGFAAPTASSSKRNSTLTRKPSERVANPTLLGAVKPGAAVEATSSARPAVVPEEPVPTLPSPSSTSTASTSSLDDPLNVAARLTALPSAPSTIFGSSSTTSFSPTAPPAPFHPITNALPSSSSAPSAVKKRVPPGGAGKKVASSSSRMARGGEKAKGRMQVEGLESRARKVQAKVGAGGATGVVRKKV
ncbi:hypothetical protein JCM8547_005409 [Rhodosporidiobolus lusitaniae]